MRIFQRIQRQYAILGIRPSKRWLQNDLPFNGRIALGFSLFACLICSQFVYIIYVANDFMEYIECICSVSGAIITFVCFAAVVYRRTTLFDGIGDIEKLIDTRCQYRQSEAFFYKTNRQIERLSEFVFMALVKIILQCLLLPKCIASFGAYFSTDSGSDSFQVPVPLWFPFDSNNPIGYLLAVTIEYILIGYQYFIAACTLALGIGAFWLSVSASKEIQRILHSINDNAQTNGNQSMELKKLFSEYVDAHTAIKQAEHDFSDIFQPIFMSLFTWSLLAISAALLIIQVEILHHESIMGVLLPLINGIVGLVLVFICCELGQRMSDAFEEIDFTIEQFDWYLLPFEIKRKLPMIISIAQQPVELECFGSMACTREVFKNVIHLAYSYFMVLRQFDAGK